MHVVPEKNRRKEPIKISIFVFDNIKIYSKLYIFQ